MKTTITTICLAIILQFSAHTSVYADTATICAGEKYRAQNQGIPMSAKCKRNAAYGESSNLLPNILLGIVVLVIGIPLVAFLFAGIPYQIIFLHNSVRKALRLIWVRGNVV